MPMMTRVAMATWRACMPSPRALARSVRGAGQYTFGLSPAQQPDAFRAGPRAILPSRCRHRTVSSWGAHAQLQVISRRVRRDRGARRGRHDDADGAAGRVARGTRTPGPLDARADHGPVRRPAATV